MDSRPKRQRKLKTFEDFVSSDYDEDDKTGITRVMGSDDSQGTNKRGRGRPKKRQRTSLIQDIKKEPDDTCVLPTDSVIDCAARARKNTGYTKAALRSMDEIPLDVLRSINSVMLRDLFGVLESDELSRQFVYKCELIPSSCSSTFKSFGNESKARSSLEKHLLQHVEELVTESETFSDFTAESVHARERRLKKAEKERIKLESAQVVLERLPSLALKRSRKGRMNVSEVSAWSSSPSKQQMSEISEMVQPIVKTEALYLDDIRVERECDMESSASEIEIEDFDNSPIKPRAKTSNLLQETESLISKRTEMLEKLQSQLRLERQPYKDHCYPLLIKGHLRHDDMMPVNAEEKEERFKYKPFALANKSEWYHSSDSEGEDVIQHDLACHYNVTGPKFKTGYMVSSGSGGSPGPVVQLLQIPKRQVNAPAVGEEVVIMKSKPKALIPSSARNGCIIDSESDDDDEPITTTLHRPYPPMPKYLPELGTKLVIPEEEVSFIDNDEDIPAQWDFTNPDHVKRYAVRCMRDLRLNKGLGIRNCTVSCKICEKVFTATATLMYHYRSHANIKPFCCLLCNATFTRQHSLNYHMLIHNDATRFKCPDCGRAFRHPSHYKEHRRKHTGEQPYHCAECDMRFKSRNTFKRHINSKHPELSAKELIAQGTEKYRKLAEAAHRATNMARLNLSSLLHERETTPATTSASSETATSSADKSTHKSSAPDASTQTDVLSLSTLDNPPDLPQSFVGKPVVLKMHDIKPGSIDLTQFTKVKLIPRSDSTSPGLIFKRNLPKYPTSYTKALTVPVVTASSTVSKAATQSHVVTNTTNSVRMFGPVDNRSRTNTSVISVKREEKGKPVVLAPIPIPRKLPSATVYHNSTSVTQTITVRTPTLSQSSASSLSPVVLQSISLSKKLMIPKTAETKGPITVTLKPLTTSKPQVTTAWKSSLFGQNIRIVRPLESEQETSAQANSQSDILPDKQV